MAEEQRAGMTERRSRKQKKGMPLPVQLILLVLVVLALRNTVGTVLVKGTSMEPNFHHGDLVLINRLSTSLGTPKRGDVVICRLEGEGKNIIKRVIGLPGDEIDIRENADGETYTLYRNGEAVTEAYIKEPMDSNGSMEYPYTVPENSYFVMGDNRNASSDSRRKTVGAIAKEDLMGKVVFRLYPFSDFGRIG